MKEIKLIVFGGRDFEDYLLVDKTIMNLSNTVYKDQAISIDQQECIEKQYIPCIILKLSN